MMTPPAVSAESLTKVFGRRAAVSGVDLTLNVGDCLAMFGPNGAGKTTLIRLLAGLLKPTTGVVRVAGVDVRSDASARAGIGLISHRSMLYAPLTALENVQFAARLYGVPDARRAALDALDAMQIADYASVQARTLSRGLLQRVSIARAIVHEPALLLLDEPYSGLDEAGAAALTRLLQTLAERGATLVIVTHNVPEGLVLATHAGIMKEGRFVRFERRAENQSFDAGRYATEYRQMLGGIGAVNAQ